MKQYILFFFCLLLLPVLQVQGANWSECSQENLVKTALQASHLKEREKAITKISEKGCLAQVAAKTKEKRIRLICVEKLIGYSSFTDYLLNDNGMFVNALIDLNKPETVPPLIFALKNGHIGARILVTKAFSTIKDSRVVDALINELKNKEINHLVVKALANNPDQKAVIPLINLLSTEHFWTKYGAIVALGNIGDKRAVNPLIKILKHELDLGESVQFNSLLHRTAEALGKIGDQRAIPVLKDTIERGSSKQYLVSGSCTGDKNLYASDKYYAAKALLDIQKKAPSTTDKIDLKIIKTVQLKNHRIQGRS